MEDFEASGSSTRPPPSGGLSSISEGGPGSPTGPPVISSEIPPAYLTDPFSAEPPLEHLRHLDATTATLAQLLSAADADVHLHSARIRAVLTNDPSVVGNYDPQTDAQTQARMLRRNAAEEERRRLQEEGQRILAMLDRDAGGKGRGQGGMTQSEVLQERLERWGRALELYVWQGGETGAAAADGGAATAKVDDKSRSSQIDLLTLLEKLCDNCSSSEEELSEALSQASAMCAALVDETSLSVRDCTEDAAEAEDAYHIRLEAHSILARRAVGSADAIGDQFRTNGRAALRIGSACSGRW